MPAYNPLVLVGIVIGMLLGLAALLVYLETRKPVTYPTAPQANWCTAWMWIAIALGVLVAIVVFGV